MINKILDIARSQIGTKEDPPDSNRTKYGAAYGWNGVAWCCIFVWWVFREAGLSELFYGGWKCAGCGTLSAWYKARGQWVTEDYRPGDLLIFDWTGNRDDTDHIGILESIDADGNYITIEGNTAVGNESNGGEVMRRLRYGWQITGACRPAYTEETEEDEMRYNTVTELPDWARATVKKLIRCGALRGGEAPHDAQGYPTDLDLSMDMVRMLVIHDRMGLYD